MPHMASSLACPARRLGSIVVITLAAWGLDPPPKSHQKPITETIHGVALTDPYRWLEDQDSPETRAWIEQQMRYTDSYLQALPGRAALHSRLESLMRLDVVTLPQLKNERYFFMRRLARENRMSIILRRGGTGKDEVLVDPNAVSSDQTVSIGLGEISHDGSLLYYTVRQGGQDEVEVRFLDVDKGKLLPDRLERARFFGLALTPDGKGIYYSRLLKEGTKVYYHRIGSEQAQDRFIFSKGTGLVPADDVYLSEEGRYLILVLGYGTSSRTEVRIKNLDKDGPIRGVATGIDAQFRPAVIGDTLYLWTNWKAPNWRLLSVDLKTLDLAQAKEVIPERDIVLNSVSYAGGRIFASFLENVQPRIWMFAADGKPLGEFPRPALGVTGVPVGDWAAKELFFSFSSFTEPGAIYRSDPAGSQRDLWHKVKIPIDTSEMEARQVWYSSKDGTKVPMWLVHKKGLRLDRERPTLLYGYGGFNLSLLPTFDPTAVLWASLGGVYAMPNLRGGGEFGEKWHHAAMYEKKQNTFDDFIGAAEYLEANRYTRPERLAISGGSNGGLLVGALITQRPTLAGAALCAVPLLDMIRFQNFLLGSLWVSEYGSAEDPKQFEYLLKYSPYQHVEKGVRYPAVMFESGDSDTRVAPLHARKMTALLQSATASGRPILLKYDTKTGHSGGKPLAKLIDDAVDANLFLLHQLGVEVK
jgi:prolyl oligopeptidase